MEEYISNPALFKKILNSCPVCFLIQQNGIVTFATPFVVNFLGVKPGDKLSDYFHDMGENFSLIPETDVNNFQASETVNFKTAFGDIKKIEIQVFSCEHEGKTLLLTWLNDISRLHDAEDTLRLLRDQSREQARASNSALATLSYDMRKAIDAFSGFSTLLRTEENAEVRNSYLDKVEQTVSTLLDELDSVAAKTTDSDKQPIFSINNILKHIEDSVRVRLEGRNLEYTVRCQSDMPEKLIGPAESIEAVLLILVKNAIGFTRKGGIKIKVSEHDRVDNEITLLISVADTGRGMKQEQVDALFPQFAREEGDDSAYRNGGLGLATAQSHVDIMHGRMWCDSVYGTGTTIYFTVTCKLPDEYLYEEADYSESDFDLQPENIRILIVDDNKVNRTVASELLKRQGFLIELAGSGTEAVDIVKADGNFALILMDIYMPDMDGGTAAKIIREIYPRIPIVALTACAMPGDKEMCLALGMNDYIVKPFDTPTFINLVKKWVST